MDEIRKHDHVLITGSYVGAADEEVDGEPFAEKMVRLTAQLKGQFAQSAELRRANQAESGGVGLLTKTPIND